MERVQDVVRVPAPTMMRPSEQRRAVVLSEAGSLEVGERREWKIVGWVEV